MKKSNRPRSLALSLFVHSTLLLVSTAMAAAQTRTSAGSCDAALEAKLEFKELRATFIKDSSSVDTREFRHAARDYIRLAEQCYELTAGESAGGSKIDDGGMWMSPAGPTTDAPVSENFVTFGTKWGAGSPFTGGTDLTGPRLPGGTVSYSFMADGVNLAQETAALTNVAVTSMATFAPCFLDEIELAFGAWSAVADILFEPVADGGGPFNVDPTGAIRIGAHVFDGPSGTLAHGYFPPPNGATAAGDIHFDSSEQWSCAPAAGKIGLGIVALHEIGHAIGLRHEATETAVMNAFYNAALTFGPLADDIIGAGEIYGEAGAAVTTFFGPVGIGTSAPTVSLDIEERTGNAAINMTASTSWQIRSNAANDQLNFVNNTDSKTPFRTARAANHNLFQLGVRGADRVDITGALFINNIGPVNSPDYVFQPGYAIEGIEEHAAYMWEHSHLPAVGAGNSEVDVVRATWGILEELEKAHIYIERLNEESKQQKSALVERDQRLAALEDRLARMEALLNASPGVVH